MRKRGIAALGLAVVLLAGCTATDKAVEKTWPGPTADQEARWVFPIDQYRLTITESGALSYADDLGFYDCMADNGFPNYQIGPAYNEAAYNTSVFSTYSDSWPIANEANATEYGYHLPPRRLDTTRDALLSMNRDMSKAMEEQFDKCAAISNDPKQNTESAELDEARDLDNEIAGDMWEIYNPAFEEAAVVEAGKKWHECMTPLGIPDLPDSPGGLSATPTASQSQSFGLDIDGPAPALSQAEIDAAVADVKCRESSGYTHALYTAIWDGEYQKLTTDSKFADRVKSDRTAMDAAVAKAKQIIAAHGGN